MPTHRMPAEIGDHALIGDFGTTALVSRDGCIDWLCWPTFASPACFTELLGDSENGHWVIHPASDAKPGEGAFLACAFWLVQALSQLGRKDEARARFEELLTLRNDVGLLSEEYDLRGRRLVGNFPQALSHISLINAGLELTQGGSARHARRSNGAKHTEATPVAGD